MVNFCVAIFILKMKENTLHFRHIILYYFKKNKTQLKCKKKICAVYGAGAVTDPSVKSDFRSFTLEISHWTMMLQGWADQLKLTAIKLRH